MEKTLCSSGRRCLLINFSRREIWLHIKHRAHSSSRRRKLISLRERINSTSHNATQQRKKRGRRREARVIVMRAIFVRTMSNTETLQSFSSSLSGGATSVDRNNEMLIKHDFNKLLLSTRHRLLASLQRLVHNEGRVNESPPLRTIF